ncbi:tyrosine-type recombinase/integrase [Streptosporangium canum]|uniref:tyrosine-type recombinase/integrase n=1 Tax=Streptosporangium canum TaxID=324952 RepID=UPI003795E551
MAAHRLRPIRVHDLRHIAASLLKKLGVAPRDAMEILGHSRISVTMEIYTHGDGESRQAALKKGQLRPLQYPVQQKAPELDRFGAFNEVGLPGLEPGTSSLSGKPGGGGTMGYTRPHLRIRSTVIHRRPALSGVVVTQLVTQRFTCPSRSERASIRTTGSHERLLQDDGLG